MARDAHRLRAVRQIDYAWIELQDGTLLAARIWLPDDAAADPVPGILEAVPYRLSDGMAMRDVLIYPWWAARGYACVRVDLRGSGESDGVLEDEYAPQEQEDLLEVIAWIARQPWCNGAVGMTGISWGGFNSLQLAARRPPALKAIITLMSTDDRYADDVHYKGGCLMGTDLLHWSSCMLHWQCQPPHEVATGERWRDLWRL
ncbi:MAG: CocE/NonD family hydrolase, partial [Actinobacteria bacterium]|nr:CocE/NonD family hydrolase [Actinomycetota bacterium]